MFKAAPLLSSNLLIIFGVCSFAINLKASSYKLVTSSVNYDHSQNLDDGRTDTSMFSFHQQHEWTLGEEAESAKAFLQYRLRVDAADKASYQNIDADNMEKLIAYVEKPWGNFKLSVGNQEVTWGENLVLPILDVVNPRDLDHVRGFYDPAAKQPSPLLNLGWLVEGWQLQLLAAPLPVKSRQPDTVGDFGLQDGRQYEWTKDAEFGGSAGYLYNGIDTRFYYYKHWPREPSYRFLPFSAEDDITIDEAMVETSGVSSSYAAFDWLLRWDLARHQNFAVTSIAPTLERINLTQSILGFTWTSQDQQSFSLQWHSDLWDRAPEAFTAGPWIEDQKNIAFMNWAGLNMNLNFMQSMFEPQVFVLRGLNNADQLLRFIVLANVTDHLTIGTEYQKTYAETTSPKLLLSKVEALNLRVTYTW
jgi:hypothetical protein